MKTSLFLANGEPAKGEKSENDEEASLNDSVEEEEEEDRERKKASTAAIRDVTNTASSKVLQSHTSSP